MIEVTALGALREAIATQRAQGARIAFVPTMGNLHEGHLSLVRHAREQADTVAVSIYVNPLQFAPDEDLADYPRTLAADCAALEQEQADILFVPDDAAMYPRGAAEQTKVEVPGLSDVLCGKGRPGHFRGVATVVNRLLNMVQPDVTLFGKKDYQQLMVIRRMVGDLALSVDIVGIETVRDDDGLALSSRNQYLNAQERAVAPGVYRTLQAAAKSVTEQADKIADVEQRSLQDLRSLGFRPDYFSVRRQQDLAVPEPDDRNLVCLAAAWLGPARLIDNVEVVI